jgi:hypothetical protein
LCPSLPLDAGHALRKDPPGLLGRGVFVCLQSQEPRQSPRGTALADDGSGGGNGGAGRNTGDSEGRAGISRILARWTEQAGIHRWRGALREEAEHCFRAALRVRDARFVPRKRRCDICKDGHGRRPRGAPFRLPGWQARRSPMRGLAFIGSRALSHVPHEDVLLDITRANPQNFSLKSLVGNMDLSARAVPPDSSARASGLDHPDRRAAALRGSERDPERTSPSMIVGMRPLGLSAKHPGSFKLPNWPQRSRLLKCFRVPRRPPGSTACAAARSQSDSHNNWIRPLSTRVASDPAHGAGAVNLNESDRPLHAFVIDRIFFDQPASTESENALRVGLQASRSFSKVALRRPSPIQSLLWTSSA